MQNTRRRMEKEMADARSYAAAGFARDMLAIKDHLERALAAVPDELRADKTAANFLAGIEATARANWSRSSRHGISRVESKGQPLDPHKHQAMIEIPHDEAEPGTIVEEMQAGYDEGPAAAPGPGRSGEEAPSFSARGAADPR